MSPSHPASSTAEPAQPSGTAPRCPRASLSCAVAIVSGLLYAAFAAAAAPATIASAQPIPYQTFRSGADGAGSAAVPLSADYVSPEQQQVNLRLGQPLGSEYSITLWFRVDSDAKDWSQSGWNPQRPVTLLTANSQDNKQSLVLRLPEARVEMAARTDQSNWQTLRSSTSVKAGLWYFVTLSVQQQSIQLWLNGELVARESLKDLPTELVSINLGRFGSSRVFPGQIVPPRFYDSPLSESQIKALAADRPQAVDAAAVGRLEADESWITFGAYPALMVAADELHPLIDQLHVSATVVPWRSQATPDLLVRAGHSRYLGSRLALFSAIGQDANELPFYDTGETLRGIPGGVPQAVPSAQADSFDLFANGEGTIYQSSSLIQMINRAKIGQQPDFAPPREVLLEGKPVQQALGRRVATWSVTDLDGDGTPDLLMTLLKTGSASDASYWPDGEMMWSGVERSNSGPGRGYDMQGKWLGGEYTTELYWAKGTHAPDGALNFQDARPVHYGHKGFSTQWRSSEMERPVAAIRLNGELVILHAGSVDQLLAMPVRMEEGELIGAEAQPLLASGSTVSGTYFIKRISQMNTPTGTEPTRILLDGNPGRLIVLEGRRIGDFEETGALQMQGGPLAVDTLATPARTDWSGNGQPDLIIGDSSGFLTFWGGTDDPTVYHAGKHFTVDGAPVHHQAGLSGSIQGPNERRWGYLQPTVGDWDNDGGKVIVTNDIFGELTLYRPADKAAPSTELMTPVRFTLNGEPYRIAWRSRPAIIPARYNVFNLGLPLLLHLDWDGDLAVGIPAGVGSTDLAEVRKLRYESGEAVRLCGPAGFWGRAELSVSDWFDDGRWQVIFGTNRSAHRFFTTEAKGGATPLLLENVGTAQEPLFRMARPITLSDGTQIDLDIHSAAAWPTDLDGDGRLDLIVGAEDGKVYYFFRNELAE